MINEKLFSLLKELPLNKRKGNFYDIKQKKIYKTDQEIQADLYRLTKYDLIEGSVQENYKPTDKGVRLIQTDIGENFKRRRLLFTGSINLSPYFDTKFYSTIERDELIKRYLNNGWIEIFNSKSYRAIDKFKDDMVQNYKRIALNQLKTIGNTGTSTEWDDFMYLLMLPENLNEPIKTILELEGFIKLFKIKNETLY